MPLDLHCALWIQKGGGRNNTHQHIVEVTMGRPPWLPSRLGGRARVKEACRAQTPAGVTRRELAARATGAGERAQDGGEQTVMDGRTTAAKGECVGCASHVQDEATAKRYGKGGECISSRGGRLTTATEEENAATGGGRQRAKRDKDE